MKRASRCEFDWKSVETETTTWSEFLNGGKAIVEQMLASEERNTVKPVQDDHSWDHSKMVLLGRWLSYKTPL